MQGVYILFHWLCTAEKPTILGNPPRRVHDFFMTNTQSFLYENYFTAKHGKTRKLKHEVNRDFYL